MKNTSFPQGDITLEEYRKYIKAYEKYCKGVGKKEECVSMAVWLPLHKMGLS